MDDRFRNRFWALLAMSGWFTVDVHKLVSDISANLFCSVLWLYQVKGWLHGEAVFSSLSGSTTPYSAFSSVGFDIIQP